MTTIDRQALEAQLRAVLDELLKLPRHPRGYNGEVQPVDLVLVPRYRSPDGRLWIADPVELDPDQGETPEADLFLREYIQIGARKGASLASFLSRMISAAAAGTDPVDFALELFRKRR